MHLLMKRLPLRVAILLALVMPPVAHAEELLLEVLSPRQGETPPIVPISGWPLVLRLSVEGNLWICFQGKESNLFPAKGQTGFLLRLCTDSERQRGDCPSSPYLARGACPSFPYEELVEFTPDLDLPGVPDYAGNSANQQALMNNPFSNGPTIQYSDPKGHFLAPIGPFTDAPIYQGEDQSCASDRANLDGYGYGADDDLPGLALFSDTGVGVVRDSNLLPYSPVSAHNLAGFFNSVSYELSDIAGKTGILASMIVPDGLFTPLILVDSCLRPLEPQEEIGRFVLGQCDRTATLWQTDGGSLSYDGPGDTELKTSVTLRAFLVSGAAPSILEDLNGDKSVGSDDAQLAGYRVLSNELVITFKQAFSCPDACPSLPFDLDLNGRTGFDLNGSICLICRVGIVSAGPRLTRVPR